MFSDARVVYDKVKDLAIVVDAHVNKISTVYDNVGLSKILRWATINWKWE